MAPASSAALKGQGFIPLTEARQIPVGSTLDTTTGTVRLTSATPRKNVLQSGDFSGGIFTVSQQRRQRGLTDLRLTDAHSARQVCAPTGKAQTARRHLSRKVIGVLRANVHGLTRVTRGVVVVRDLRLRRNISVRAGKSYLAKAPGA